MNLKINNMGNLSFQRDQFIKVIYQAAKKNKSIYFISIDFGAPALDAFRFKLKKQFIHLGICEQNAIDFASGMALEGDKVYVYAMAPFLSLRCLEQHKVATCLMNLDVCSIVTGIGLSYANSGPTHYSTEDLSCLRSIPNSYIFTASDPITASLIAKETLNFNRPKFVRLDRKSSANFLPLANLKNIKDGFRYLRKVKNKKEICIIGHGTIIERAVKAINQMNNFQASNISLIDLIRCKPFPLQLKKIINSYNKILTIDEQSSESSLGSIIFENSKSSKIIKSLSLPDKFIFENLGRDKLLDKNGLSVKNIKLNLKSLLR